MVARRFLAWALLALCSLQARADDRYDVPLAQDSITVGDRSVVIDDKRYKLQDLIILEPLVAGGQQRISADLEPYPDRLSLNHPYLWTYFIQVVCNAIAGIMGIYAPRSLLVLLTALVLVWPLSAATGEPIYAMVPGDFMWWMMCAKSVIVNIAPTAPMLLVLIFDASEKWRNITGFWVYGILFANIAWTLCFPMPDLIMKVNAVCGASLCVSLIIHLAAVRRYKCAIFEVRSRVVLGYGTTLSWVICYTVWNALFVADFAVGLTLQDILFWCVMFYLSYASDRVSSIENYFAMARPIQLSIYIGVSDWTGLIPFFRDAWGIGLDVNRHAYILFIAIMNTIYSMAVLVWSVMEHKRGLYNKGQRRVTKELDTDEKI